MPDSDKAVTAGDLMTGDILRARVDWPVRELTEFLTSHSISGAPVVSEDGRLVGVVSLTDVARHDPAGKRAANPHHHYLDGPAYVFAPLRHPSHARHRRGLTVREIMTPMVFDVPVSATVSEIADAMVRGRIHRVFVTEGGMVVGVISALDLLRVLV